MKKFLSLLACGAMLAGFAATSHAQMNIDQIKMSTGNGNYLTLLTTAPGGNYNLTIPDPGAAANFILSGTNAGTQTIGGTLNLSGTVNFTSTPALPLAVDQIFIGNGASPSVAAASGALLTVNHTTGALTSAAGITATAGNINVNTATDAYQIGGNKVLWIPGPAFFENVFVGRLSGNPSADFTTADANIAIGQALNVLFQGRDNVGIGFASLGNTTNGLDNVAIGSWSGTVNTVGNHNTFLGRESNASVNNLSGATAVGYQATVTGSNTIQLGSTSLVAVKTSAPITTGDGTHAGGLSVTDNASHTATLNNSGGSAATFSFPATGGTLATTGSSVVYGGSNATEATGGTALFNVAYAGSNSGNPIGAIINSSATSGNATGLTVDAAGTTGSSNIAIEVKATGTGAGTNYDLYNWNGNWSVTDAGAATFAGVTDNALTASEIVVSDGAKALASEALVTPAQGGTGVNNGSSTITLGGNFTTSGANTLTLTTTGATNVTLPTSGTLATTGNTVLFDVASAQTMTDGNFIFDLNDAPTAGVAAGAKIVAGGTGGTSNATGLAITSTSTTGNTGIGLSINESGGSVNKALLVTGAGGNGDVLTQFHQTTSNPNLIGLFDDAYNATSPAFVGYVDGFGNTFLTANVALNINSGTSAANVNIGGGIYTGTVHIADAAGHINTVDIGNGTLGTTQGSSINITSVTATTSAGWTVTAAGAGDFGTSVTDGGLSTAGIVTNSNTGLLGTEALVTVAQGGTGANLTLTTGDLIDAASSSAMGNIADVATGSVLISKGTGVAPAYSTTPTVSSATMTATTNQLTLGTTNTTTISSTAPSASRTYTIPDAGANADIGLIYSKGSATLAGGSIAVVTTVPAGSIIIFSATTVSTPGALYLSARNGAGFTIASTNGADASTVEWAIVIP